MQTMVNATPRHKTSGFTLIELMFAVVILAILATIATSVYASYILSGRLSESFAALGDYRLKLEQFRQDNRSYADPLNANTCGIAPPANNSYFDFSCVIAASGAQFTATASNKAGAGMGNAAAYAYTIDQDGMRNTLTFAGAPGPGGIWKNK